MNNDITIKQAYEAMYLYLVQLYEMSKSDDIGGLLGSMSTLPNGEIADPAIWSDWLECVEQAKTKKVDTKLNCKHD